MSVWKCFIINLYTSVPHSIHTDTVYVGHRQAACNMCIKSLPLSTAIYNAQDAAFKCL